MTTDREWAEAYAPGAIQRGAVVPLGAMDLAREITRYLVGAMPTTGGLLLPSGAPVLARGDAWIVPLSWEPAAGSVDAAGSKELRTRANQVWSDVHSWMTHEFGGGWFIDLDDAETRSPYAERLVRTGVWRADWWQVGESYFVLAVHGKGDGTPAWATCVHVVPAWWVTQEHPKGKRNKKSLPDLSWSWSDAIDLRSREHPSALDGERD